MQKMFSIMMQINNLYRYFFLQYLLFIYFFGRKFQKIVERFCF